MENCVWGGVLLFSLSMSLTSCEGALDDILGEWSRPTPGGGSSSDEPTPITNATPLTVETITAGTIMVESPQSGMQYSLNGGAKTAVTTDAITVGVGDKVAFYGSGTTITSYNGTQIAGGTAEVKVYGNIMSLVDETGYETATALTVDNTFQSLFKGNAKLTDASGLLLPATSLAKSCYESMFFGCTSLTTAPAKLPATSLAKSCYESMFSGCKALTAAPELKATTLDESCYRSMFSGCTSLTTAPELPATTLAESCYQSMFEGCKALTAAPELKAETLAKGCYFDMFHGCTSLKTAPALPAKNLANDCYNSMFYGCTSLETAPKLPAETLAKECYYYMFYNCTALTTAYVKAAYTTVNEECYKMFEECTATGAKLHTTATNQASWDGVMGSGKTWSNWTAANDWTD